MTGLLQLLTLTHHHGAAAILPLHTVYAVTDRLDRDSAGGCWVVRAAVAAADSAAAVAAADSAAAAVASVVVDADDSADAVAAADSAADVADSSIVSTI